MILRHKHSCQSDPNVFTTCAGDTFHVIKEGRMQSDGTIKLIVTGRENIQDKINSFASTCDMALIIQRLQMGDTSVLNPRKPLYGDFTQFPQTYAECLDLVQRSEEVFENLSVEVKQSFDNDINKWFASIGSPSWLEAMGMSPAASPAAPDPDTNRGE